MGRFEQDTIEQLSAAIEHLQGTIRSLTDQRKNLLDCAQSMSKSLAAANGCLTNVKSFLTVKKSEGSELTVTEGIILDLIKTWENGGELNDRE